VSVASLRSSCAKDLQEEDRHRFRLCQLRRELDRDGRGLGREDFEKRTVSKSVRRPMAVPSALIDTDLRLDIMPTLFAKAIDDRELGLDYGLADGEKSERQTLNNQRVGWNQSPDGTPCREVEHRLYSDVRRQHRMPIREDCLQPTVLLGKCMIH